jgi:YggT family protein
MIVIVSFLTTLLYAFIVIMLIRVIFSWVSPFPTNPVSRFAWVITEPILAPIRRLLPAMAGLDLSPMVALIAAYLLIAFIGDFAR